MPERQVLPVRPLDVQLVGAGVARAVVLGGGQRQQHDVTGRDLHAADRHRPRGEPQQVRRRAVEAQELLDGAGQQRRRALQQFELLGVAQQRQRAVAHQVDRGRVARHEQQERERREFAVGQRGLALGARQGADEVVVPGRPLVRHEVAQVAGRLLARRGRVAVGHAGDHVRPVAEVLLVDGRHAEQVHQHGDRQWRREVRDQIAAARLREAVGQRRRQRFHARPQTRDAAGRELARHRAAQAGVVGRVVVHHVVGQVAEPPRREVRMTAQWLGERGAVRGQLRVVQRGAHVGVAGHEPHRHTEGLDPVHGARFAQALQHRVRVVGVARAQRIQIYRHVEGHGLEGISVQPDWHFGQKYTNLVSNSPDRTLVPQRKQGLPVRSKT